MHIDGQEGAKVLNEGLLANVLINQVDMAVKIEIQQEVILRCAFTSA